MKRKLREYKDATVSRANTLAGILIIGGIALAVIAVVFLLLISADSSVAYEDENEKLDVYAEQLYAALSKGVIESGAREIRESDEDKPEVDVNMSEYAFVGAYLEAYKNDIDVEALDQTHKVFYNDSLRGLTVFDNMANAVERADLESFKRAASADSDDKNFLQLYEEYTNVSEPPGEPMDVEAFRE